MSLRCIFIVRMVLSQFLFDPGLTSEDPDHRQGLTGPNGSSESTVLHLETWLQTLGKDTVVGCRAGIL